MKRLTSPIIAVLLALFLITNTSITAQAGISFISGQGVVLTGADGVVLTGADGVVLTGADGVILTGADGVVLTGADGVVLTGADTFTYTGVDGVVLTGADSGTGIQSLDPALALLLNGLPDTSAINVFIIFHQMPTAADFNALRAVGIIGGTCYHNLPIILTNATKQQVAAISTLPSVRSIYSNKTLQFFDTDTRIVTGQRDTITDSNLTAQNGGMPVSGQGVTVAVIDTGVDATHPDLAQKVVQNVLVADLQGFAPAFMYPIDLENLPDTDLIMGHGTLVSSIIAGTGAASGGYYGGMAPGAKILGVSAGNASLFFVLSAIDYVLSHRVDQNIRVVNCSFGISGIYDINDPVNIATKIMHDSGIAVVFSAGNDGNEPNSLNPYSVAPWVIGVGAGTRTGSLCDFSSRGAAGYGDFYPTLIAPGDSVVGARALGVNVVGTAGLTGGLISPANDLKNIPLNYLPRYTSSSGTSFSAPHVAGTIALMLQANPNLQVDDIKTILQETATPLLGYSRYEVGAGYLNTYAAVRKAAFNTPFGAFRSQLAAPELTVSRTSLSGFSGSVAPGATWSMPLNVPGNALFATTQLTWQNKSLLGMNFLLGSNLKVTLRHGSTNIQAQPAIQLLGPSSQKMGVTINDPSAGAWTLYVTNTGNFLTGTILRFNGAIEMIGIQSNIAGLDQLSPTDQQTALRALRSGVMSTGSSFSAYSPATRLEAARALMLGAGLHVPQYLPYSPTYTDMSDANAIFAESVTHSPNGNLLNVTDAQFNPSAPTDRLTMAIAMVKALGLTAAAQSACNTNPGLADWQSIPQASRGYVSVAVTRGLMSANDSSQFRPSDPINHLELANAAMALLQASR